MPSMVVPDPPPSCYKKKYVTRCYLSASFFPHHSLPLRRFLLPLLLRRPSASALPRRASPASPCSPPPASSPLAKPPCYRQCSHPAPRSFFGPPSLPRPNSPTLACVPSVPPAPPPAAPRSPPPGPSGTSPCPPTATPEKSIDVSKVFPSVTWYFLLTCSPCSLWVSPTASAVACAPATPSASSAVKVVRSDMRESSFRRSSDTSLDRRPPPPSDRSPSGASCAASAAIKTSFYRTVLYMEKED